MAMLAGVFVLPSFRGLSEQPARLDFTQMYADVRCTRIRFIWEEEAQEGV